MTDVNEPVRPDPDDLLARLNQEERTRGRLRIFLGMCPGVGKTYAMLQAARQRRGEGVDVVVGVAETHGRTETAALLDGLEILPRVRRSYRGAVLEELDLDGLLRRKPGLAVVDELAHTNAPGARHPKRYDDVLELLAAGIDVFTTLNVQHVESRAPVVREIAGIPVNETVPDSILDRADELQLIDLSPEQLRQRLAEGRVYLGDRAHLAAENFFRESNLTALREMALRVTAERVDQGMRDYMRDRKIEGPWKSRERLLVGVGPSPYAGDLVRWTRRIASALDASWLAVYVDTGRPLSAEEKARVTQHLALARQLGGDVESVAGSQVADELLRMAREQNVTQIVVGKPSAAAWLRLLSGDSLVDALLRRSGNIDVYVVRPDKKDLGPPVRSPRVAPWFQLGELGVAATLLAATTLLGMLVRDVVGYWSVALFYLLMVVLSALSLRRRVVLLAALSGAVLWNFLFVPPLYTFHIARFHDGMMFAMMIVVALAMGHLTSRLRQRAQGDRERQRRTAALLQLTQSCSLEHELDAGLTAALRQVDEVFGARSALYLRGADRLLAAQPHPSSSWQPPTKEHSVAMWSFANRQPAGRGTNTLPGSDGLFLPLQTTTSLMGVLGVLWPAHREVDLPERDLLAAFTAQIALALEKDHFRLAFQRAEVIQESNRLRRTLLDNVSHELRTPLTTLKAAVGSLQSQLGRAHPEAQPVLDEVGSAVTRLNQVVGLLVESARLETGKTPVVREWCEPRELIQESLRLCGAELFGHPVEVAVHPEPVWALVDVRLLQQALVHVIRNAATHTPAGTAVMIQAHAAQGRLRFVVRDHGPGFADVEQIFNKFYRGPHAPAGGLGLGLSITRGLVSALDGEVQARNHPDGGAEVTLVLPAELQSVPSP
jgi:two-component system sensor histidine kinase KdpD